MGAMWIVIRLILAAIGFAIRLLRRAKHLRIDGYFEGAAYSETIHKNKRKITGFTIGMPRTSPTWIRFHAESAIDRMCKRLGIANELQTGDPAFDDKVYVTCDHPHVHTVLRGTKPLRDAIHAVFDAGYASIQFDGAAVRMKRSSPAGPTETDLQLLKNVWAAAAALEHEPPSRLADPFLWKAVLIEGAIWGIAGYAIGAFVDWRVRHEDHHLWPREVVTLGVIVALAIFVVLVGLIALWMRGSSRGHRVIVESAIVLALGLPVSSIQLVDDTNRALDAAPSTFAEDTLDHCETRRHRTKRSYYYTYHLHLIGTAERAGPQIPREVTVPYELCRGDGAPVRFEIGPGRWGIPWYRRIQVGDVTWSNSL
jgi:hypothetical protein